MNEARAQNMERDLESSIESALSETAPTLRTSHIKPSVVPKTEMSLSQQWEKFEIIGIELQDRIRKERLKFQSDYEMKAIEIRNTYAAKMSEEVARLEKLRDKELRELLVQMEERVHEHEILMRRVSGE